MRRLVSLVLLGLCSIAFAEDPVGRYKRVHDQDLITQLEAIGYLDGVVAAPVETGVTTRSALAWPGLNLYASGHAPEAILMDMEGNTIHTWRRSFAEVWGTPKRDHSDHHWWRRVHLLDDGGLLAIFESKGLIRLDRDSKLLWAHRGREHHDLEVRDDGTILTLTRKPRSVGDAHVVDDHVAWLDADGNLLREVSILDAVQRSSPELAALFGEDPDLLHTNSLRLLDGRVDHPAFAAGNLLLSFRTISAIAVLDPETERVVWSHRGSYEGQHDPQVVGPRTLVLFDNRRSQKSSRVLELDPRSGVEGWSYGDEAAEAFFSATCGTLQRLPNGNTLVTVSDAGEAFEVSRSGDVVWRFVSPHRAESDPSLVATLMEVERLPLELDWL